MYDALCAHCVMVGGLLIFPPFNVYNTSVLALRSVCTALGVLFHCRGGSQAAFPASEGRKDAKGEDAKTKGAQGESRPETKTRGCTMNA